MDSIPLCGDNDQTQLPCSPSELMSTSTVASTLNLMKENDDANEAGEQTKQYLYMYNLSGGNDFAFIYIYTCIYLCIQMFDIQTRVILFLFVEDYVF